MKIVSANAMYLDPNNIHPYAFMEKAGRTCYKSEDKITDESAVKFVQRLLKSGHTAMLEHAHIIIDINEKALIDVMDILDEIFLGARESEVSAATLRNYFNITATTLKCYISGSFRSFINLFKYAGTDKGVLTALYIILNKEYPELFPADENSLSTNYIINASIKSREDFVKDVNKTFDTKSAKNIIMKHLVHTMLFTCDRGVSHEFVRHRPASFAQESTRYCNYSQDKFNNEITVVRPCFWSEEKVTEDENGTLLKRYTAWQESCECAESKYFELLDSGATPQEARDVLPTSVKTELIMTATENEWQHIVNLRHHGTTGAPHPQMIECMAIAAPRLFEQSDNRIS